MQTWNWVTGAMGHLGHLSRPGHRVIILTRCETWVCPVFKKCPKCKTYIWIKCWNDKSHCKVSVVGLKSLDMSVRAMNFYFYLWLLQIYFLAWEYFFTHRPKSTFGVHYRTGSPGQLDLRVAGFPGHWVAGSQNVTQFHLCFYVRQLFTRSTRLTLDYTLFALIHCYVFSAAYLYKHSMIWRRYHTAGKLEGPHVGCMSNPFLSPLLALFAVSCSSTYFFHTRTFPLKFD